MLWFYIFFSAGQGLLWPLGWCSASTSVSEGVFLMYPWREMWSTSSYCSAILFFSTFWLWEIRLLWTFMCTSLGKHIHFFHSCWYKPRKGIVGSYGKQTFNFRRNSQTVFHHGVLFWFPISSAWKCQYFHFFITPVLVCSLMRDIPMVWPECLLAICISLFTELPVQIFCPFFCIGAFHTFCQILTFFILQGYCYFLFQFSIFCPI